ncbi:MAG TPA: cobalt ECF transporter T component CbiQ [Verrucomicrobiae bacterium]|nr:cobalt ECF transporter T component CbiQ [Verrucomicrobiae bacterium]
MHPPATEPARTAPLFHVEARIKLLGALALLVGIALLPRRLTLLYLFPSGVVLALWLWARMPFGYALRRLFVVEWFVLGIGLLTLLHPGSLPLFFSIVAKSNLCMLTVLLLTWTTPFQDLLQALRRFRFPPVMLGTLALMYRYLPLLVEESRRMHRARASRTFSRRRGLAWHNLAAIIAQLFVRSAERAERIYLAMCARGWK